MSLFAFANSTFSILTIVALYNGALLTALAFYLYTHRGRSVLR
jgi:hypothetical protein